MEDRNEEKTAEWQQKEFANLQCDFMFKRMFCSEANKDVLIWFLNMVLEDVNIVDVDFIPTEHLGLTEEDRKVIFDISCRCKDGKTFIIEMQKGYQKYFRERALYYTTYPINAQGREARDRHEADRLAGKLQEKFKWDYNLKPVIVVALLNFEFKHWDNWPDEKYLSSYRLLEDATHEPMTNTLRFVFLELGRFKKSVSELNTAFEKWVYLLKNMQNMKQIPPEFNEPLFKRLFLMAEIGKFTPQELEQYYKSLNNMGDYDNIISTAKEEAERIGRELGLKLGLEQGRTEGRAKAQLEIARKMLESGMPADQIAQFTGISVEELAAM